MNGAPKQKAAETESHFEDWQDWHLPEKSHHFEYSDSTEDHIDMGESQKFHYEGNDLPEK